jgi:hypothetical protein
MNRSKLGILRVLHPKVDSHNGCPYSNHLRRSGQAEVEDPAKAGLDTPKKRSTETEENSKIKEQHEKSQFKIENCRKSKRIKTNEEIWSVRH